MSGQREISDNAQDKQEKKNETWKETKKKRKMKHEKRQTWKETNLKRDKHAKRQTRKEKYETWSCGQIYEETYGIMDSVCRWGFPNANKEEIENIKINLR